MGAEQNLLAKSIRKSKICTVFKFVGIPGVLRVAGFIRLLMGHLAGSVGRASHFGSGHNLAVREFEPRDRPCADGSEPGACFGFCVSLSLTLPCSCSVSLFLKNQ